MSEKQLCGMSSVTRRRQMFLVSFRREGPLSLPSCWLASTFLHKSPSLPPCFPDLPVSLSSEVVVIGFTANPRFNLMCKNLALFLVSYGLNILVTKAHFFPLESFPMLSALIFIPKSELPTKQPSHLCWYASCG